MTHATDLIGLGPRRTAFDILRAAYGELWVTDLEASSRFYVDHLGLVVSARTDDTLYLRGWEERTHHSLVLRERGPRLPPACRFASAQSPTWS